MNDEHRQNLLDQYEEAAMMLLLDEYAEAEGARLLKEFEEADKNGEVPQIPEDLDAKCRQLIQDSFAKQSRKNHLIRITKSIAKAAVFVFLFLGLTTTAVLSVDALRIPVLNFFLQRSDRYTAIGFDEEQNSNLQVERVISNIEVIIPAEYELVSEVCENEGYFALLYQNSENHVLSFEISPLTGQMYIDTEDSSQKEMTINDYPAIFVDKDGYHVMWFDTDKKLTYNLYATNLSTDIFWKLAYVLAG